MSQTPGFAIPFSYSSINSAKDWEAELEAHKKFLRMSPENRDLFFALLGKENDCDSYTTSPVYYALTGRKGLWVYQDGNTYIPLCWHPNVDEQILIFPPCGKKNPQILERLLNEIPVPPGGIRIGRLKKPVVNLKQLAERASVSLERSVSLLPVEEMILDWRFPVRILSTERIAKLEGNEYYNVRHSLNKAKRYNIVTERLVPHHEKQIVSFVYKWANKRTNNVNELIELIAPYQQTISLLGDESFNLDGLMFYINGETAAIAMWELPNTKTGTANAWMALSDTTYKGISEYMMKKTGETLYAKNVPYINFGGSETQGLDNYKNKYLPVQSIELASVEAIIEGRDLLLETLIKFNETRIAA